MEPRSLEDYFVAALEKSSDCAPNGVAVIPPPSNCPKSVHAMHALGQAHVFTILVVLVFVVVIIQMTMIAINPNAGGH